VVRLDAEHRFHSSPADVCDAMGDPAFYATLRLPDIEPPEVLSRTATGEHVDISIRFEYTGKLDPIVRRIVGHERVAWVQELGIDRDTCACTLAVKPDVGVVPVSCSGTFALRDDGDGCVRTLRGELKIKVPIIGGRAEKSLAPGILRRIDLEAVALDEFLAG
jgi:hypothetical protein